MAFTTRNGRTQTQLSEINMIPFIDIMLVLLVIFMITAPVIQSGIEIQVPRTQTVRAINELRMVIQIDAEQRMYLQSAPVNINELVARISALQPDPELRDIYMVIDESVPWGTMAAVMGRLNAAGIHNIALVTEPID